MTIAGALLPSAGAESVERSPDEVVVKNDDPAAIFHQGADHLEQVAKLGEVVGSQVAETKTEFGHAAEDLPI